MRLLALLAPLLATVAHAEPLPPIADAPLATAPVQDATSAHATTSPALKIAFAVNPPFRWFAEDKAFGASAYLAIGEHHVIRGNVARYPFGPALDLSGETAYDGTTTDGGASYMYFTDRAFRGFVAEVGALVRATDGYEMGPFWDEAWTDTRLVGGRGLLGYSVLFADRVFTSVQAGATFGHESGTRAECNECDMPTMQQIKKVDRNVIEPELFVRIGVVFDL